MKDGEKGEKNERPRRESKGGTARVERKRKDQFRLLLVSQQNKLHLLAESKNE